MILCFIDTLIIELWISDVNKRHVRCEDGKFHGMYFVQ